MATTTPAPFTLKDDPVENFRPLKVRVIGAGFSGIYLGVRIPQRLRNIDLQIYEKNDGIGGTWWENRYPGCACDIPAHTYQYTFEPNPRWSGFYASSEEICEYLQNVADKYDVRRFVKLNHKVVACTWDDSIKKWRLSVQETATGETFMEEADLVISCRGSLNEFTWPDIPGLQSFEGEKMHSAAWNESYDFRHKKIGVIGGGSSSIQIVPVLQKEEGAHLSCFVRSKVWISDRFGDHVMRSLGLDPTRLGFTEEEREEFATNAEKYLKFRKAIEEDGNSVHASTQRGSEMAKMFVEMFAGAAKTRLLKKPELLEYFNPTFGVGCRRLTPGPGYLEALVSDNVDFIPDKIETITPKGIQLENGRHVDLDVLCCATGFNTSSVPPFPVTGKNGATLKEKFSPYPKTYLSLAVDDFPNFFIMLGPNSGIGAGTLTILLEAEGDYIIKCIRKLQKEDYVTMAPKRARVEDFSEYVGEYFKKTIYADDCKSWYKSDGGRGDRITALWPGSILQAMEVLRAPRWEDFDFESHEDNKLRWLGNGWSVTLLPGQGDPSWYLNAEELDFPPADTPENDPKYRNRPFSH
ncbi:flavin-binding monooxygenase [Exophiala viscosa]|uniref:Flavin-binding monooxygenase n=1 Tax=Exophiala viscosa TaxID=2486360 RepID=A0AAN6DUH3_9EURO|nr:flavin-binding monooxygenase [Exophiala viscosa]